MKYQKYFHILLFVLIAEKIDFYDSKSIIKQMIKPKILSINRERNPFKLSIDSVIDIRSITMEIIVFGIVFTIDLNRSGKNRCHFTGRINKSDTSLAEFDLCSGLNGQFKWDNKICSIRPNKKTKYFSKIIKPGIKLSGYYIYFHIENSNKPLFSCNLIRDQSQTYIPPKESFTSVFQRIKRDLYPYVDSEIIEQHIIELLIVVTGRFFKRLKNDLEQYILTNVAIATKLLRHPTIKASISIDIVDIIPIDEDYEKENNLHDWNLLSQDQVVSRFCKWLQKKRKSFNYSWDSAILINDGYFSTNAIGIAHLRSMCNEYNCLAVVDRGFGTGFIIAHELAHQMNARHDFDDSEACHAFEQVNGRKKVLNTIMSTSLHFENYPFIWSSCSQNLINIFLKSKDSHCLKQQNQLSNLYSHENISQHLQKYSTGVDYDLDQQCSFAFGEPATFCKKHKRTIKTCSVLYCQLKRIPSCIRAEAMIADGTRCDFNKHCIHGKCVNKNVKIIPINGGWSLYSPWSNCSRPCDGGVEFSYRTCTNPIPAFGGRFCVGTKERIRSCNLKPCSNSIDPREELCMKNNLKPYIPQVDEEFACNLVCITNNHTLKYDIALTDGTPCSPLRSDICVKGTCYKTGCDRVVGSKKAFDNCQKCGGKNDSCSKVEGFYNWSNVFQGPMEMAFRVPVNVTNLFIRKVSQRHEAYSEEVYDDFELLLVIDKRTVIRRSETIEPLAGGQLHYSGANKKEETIEIKGKINKEIIVVIKMEGQKTHLSYPSINYHYYTIKDTFTWKYLDPNPSVCHNYCSGLIEIIPTCFRENEDESVSNEKCSKISKPKNKIQKCLTICGYRWEKPDNNFIKYKTDNFCPVRCGEGVLKIWYFCQKRNEIKKGHYKWETVNIDKCFSAFMPERQYLEEKCVGQCYPLIWTYGKWEDCPIECGTGFRYRSSTCGDIKGNSWSPEICLKHLGGPEDKETCLSFINCKNITKWMTSPWSRCSKTCDTGIQRRTVYCFKSNIQKTSKEFITERFLKENEQISDAFCKIHHSKPKTERSCRMDSCYKWIIDKRGECSATCGSGFRIFSHVCTKNTPYKSRLPHVNESFCLSNGFSKPDLVKQTCFNKECPIKSFWFPMNWERCSNLCGEGIQTRSLKCGYKTLNGSMEFWNSNDPCENLTKPTETQKCEGTDCPIWVYGTWSECEGTCLYGIRHRLALCTDPVTNKILPNSECNIYGRYSNVKRCLLPNLCGYWKVNKWSQCSVSCGLGIKTRTVLCHYYNGTKSDDYSICQNASPFDEIHCQNQPCESHHFWWSKKSSECYGYNCNPGIVYTNVRCVDRNLDEIADQMCYDVKHPNYYAGCINKNCRQYFWVAESWDNYPCLTNSCMMTIRNRNVTCVDDYGQIYQDSFCEESLRPDTWRLCPSPKNCSDVPRSCKELKMRYPRLNDGEYSLAIDLNWAYFIYCADMNTDMPKEYLTLKELNYARSSKFISAEKTSCNYDEEIEFERSCPNCRIDESLWSISYYDKIRINITDLSVDILDNRFSMTSGPSYIPYATAKDCSGNINCPKGHFKIDLRGTGFSISMKTVWNELHTKYGYRILRTQASQIIKGWCGGHCSGCTPLEKLYIEPQMYGRDFEVKSKEVIG